MRKLFVFISFVGAFFSLDADESLHDMFKSEVECWPEFRDVHDEKTTSQVYKDAYDIAKNLKNFRQSQRIEKIIHHICLSGPISDKFIELMETFKECHPEFKFMLWTAKDVGKIRLNNRIAYRFAPDLVTKTNILKLELLYQFGGVCIDVNADCLFPLDIFHHITDFYACFCHENHDKRENIGNCILGAVKKHPLIKTLMDDIKVNMKVLRKQGKKLDVESIDIAGTKILSNTIRTYFEQGLQKKDPFACVVLPKPFFNSLLKHEVNDTFDPLEDIFFFVFPYSYTISYWPLG